MGFDGGPFPRHQHCFISREINENAPKNSKINISAISLKPPPKHAHRKKRKNAQGSRLFTLTELRTGTVLAAGGFKKN